MTGYRGLPLVGRGSREARFDVRRGLPGWQGGRLALAETGMAAFRAFEGEADTGCKHKAVAFLLAQLCAVTSLLRNESDVDLSILRESIRSGWLCRRAPNHSHSGIPASR
jgi:hypothetical protein